ncbi:hypothetical protein Cenrod_2164 [Candidatus Symbiobacter mobilis CR]|uniref:Uncharacterized protein n=1 Tax=Candidatus Symbiobacter mobilis CR TaxID=946483 RepID=U5NDB4_9BURK|nr:hypothetical protein Cenrod_2164 [Candidatus Symbiobacter mobilis CR]
MRTASSFKPTSLKQLEQTTVASSVLVFMWSSDWIRARVEKSLTTKLTGGDGAQRNPRPCAAPCWAVTLCRMMLLTP